MQTSLKRTRKTGKDEPRNHVAECIDSEEAPHGPS